MVSYSKYQFLQELLNCLPFYDVLDISEYADKYWQFSDDMPDECVNIDDYAYDGHSLYPFQDQDQMDCDALMPVPEY